MSNAILESGDAASVEAGAFNLANPRRVRDDFTRRVGRQQFMVPENNFPAPANSTDTLFKRIIIVACALSLATMYGWLACVDRQPDGSFNFHWQWIALLWIAIGVVTNAYFWRKVWPSSAQATVTRKDIFTGAVVLGVPCLWWLTFPLRFLSGQHFWDVMAGLIAAAAVLSFGAWMVIKLIKAFEQSDTDDLKAETQNAEATADKK
jgi:hypothetical protein